MRRWQKIPLATWVGAVLCFVVICVALLADVLAPQSPFKSRGGPFIPPSAMFWFGSDDLGRDVFSGVVHGARTSLVIGMVVALTSLLIGAGIGSVAGYFGGWLDDGLMRFAELIQILPRFFLALLVVALMGSSLAYLIAVLAFTAWPFTARLARAGVMSVREREFIVASRALGMGHGRVLWAHVLPNIIAPVLVQTTLQFGRAILIEAGLSFLGLGDPNVMSWGYLLNNAQRFAHNGWWLSVFPGSAIALTSLGVNLLGDGLFARRR